MEEVIFRAPTVLPRAIIDGKQWTMGTETEGPISRIFFEQRESRTKLIFWEGDKDLVWPTLLYGMGIMVGTPQHDLAVKLVAAGLGCSTQGIDELPGEFT